MRPLPLIVTVALGTLLAAGAGMEPTLDPGDLPITIVDEPLHIGDNSIESFARATPDGTEATREFRLTGRPKLPCLVMRVHHVVPGDHKDFLAGSYHDVIDLNGNEIVTLNTLVPTEKGGPYTLIVPVEAGALERGTNRITVRAGKHGNNHDDFEWGPVRLLEGCRVRIRVEEDGKRVPARIQIHGAGEMQRLSFGPRHQGKGAGHLILAPAGEAEAVLPRGEPFDVWAFRGIEYTAAKERIAPGKPEETVTLAIDRVVDTAGWISGDFHLHADPSGDSHVALTDRVASLIATGVEFGVATDHNRITDYSGAVKALRAGRWLRTAPGDEITTRSPEQGHFNAFPLKLGLAPVPFQDITPEEIFAAARRDYGAKVVQANHPRSGSIGYFGIFDFDRAEGRGRGKYSDAFDAVEVFNGLCKPEENEAVLGDWYSILNHGKRVTATGNSDSHTIIFQDAGYPRNFVQVGKDDPSRIRVEDVAAAVRAGRVIVSSGPFIEASVAGKGIGETATVRPGVVPLEVKVQAAPWVEVDLLEVVVNGEVKSRIEVPSSEEPIRLQEKIPLSMEADGFVVVLARGKGYRAPAVTQPNVTPLAFTNPIWIKVRKGSD